MSQFKIKQNGQTFAQAAEYNVAAFIAYNYNADVNFDNRKMVWSAEKDAFLIQDKSSDEAIKIMAGAIGVRTAQYRREANARYIKKMQELGQFRLANKVGA